MCFRDEESWSLRRDSAVMFHCFYYCVCSCVFDSVKAARERSQLQPNENANHPFCVNLPCQSNLQHCAAFNLSQKKVPTINLDVTGLDHSTEPLLSFITEESVPLTAIFSPHVHVPLFHWFSAHRQHFKMGSPFKITWTVIVCQIQCRPVRFLDYRWSHVVAVRCSYC